jgi:sec-independent protein translocase protein TatB
VFFDIGPFELVTIVLLGVIVFGPDKLPKLIQDLGAMIRKLREFSDSAKADLRKELGPEFKDFEFEDLNPKTFVRKNLLENDSLGLKDLRSSLDLKEEVSAVSDAVRESSATVRGAGERTPAAPAPAPVNGSGILSKRPAADGDLPPFDADAT